ncbi:MAG: hypothetical protein MRJ66_09615 [Nitrospira sp.]|nr:hypothetical protein [Nitrospira sp.]
MRQTTQGLLFFSGGITIILFSLSPGTSYVPSASAATSSVPAAQSPSSSHTSKLPAPLLRLMAEMPVLRQLVAPPTITQAPVPPTIGVNPTSLSFTIQQGNGNPAPQTINVSNTGGGTLNWNARANATWLTLSPVPESNGGTITVNVATGALGIGTHSGAITVTAQGANNASVPVTVIVTEAPVPPSIGTTPSNLTFAAQQGGGNPAPQTLNISNTGGGTLNWNVHTNATWLILSQPSGSGNGAISVKVEDLGSLSVGTHNALITITAGGITRTVQVTLTVSAGSLTVTPGNLTFTATQGAANPSAQTITLGSTGTWTANHNASWLSLSPASGTKNGTIVASVNTATAKPGDNTATITITGGGLTKTANVLLSLNAPLNSSATLTWNANKEKDLAGYKVYRATASGAYGAPIATLIGNVTTYRAIDLKFGTTYFFVVTAFDIAGNESEYSNEVSKSIF